MVVAPLLFKLENDVNDFLAFVSLWFFITFAE